MLYRLYDRLPLKRLAGHSVTSERFMKYRHKHGKILLKFSTHIYQIRSVYDKI